MTDLFILNGVCPLRTKHLYDICAMLDQRRRSWADIVQMLYECFVFAGDLEYTKTTF